MDSTPGEPIEPLLVEHLRDVEAAVRHIAERLDPVLWREIGKVVERRIDALGWKGESEPDEHTFWLTPEHWMTPEAHRGAGDEDAWFAIDPMWGDDDETDDATSLAAFIGASAYGNRWALCFKQQVATTRPFRAALAAMEEGSLDEVRALGFEIDQRAMILAIPLTLDAQAVGQALADGAFEEALAPIERALDAAAAAVPALDRLVARLREGR